MNINHVTMCASNYEATKQFYETTLHFPLTSEEHNRFTIKVGTSMITFVEAPLEKSPFYHFAFDVPSNQFEEAKAWIKEKTELSQEQGEDEVYFPFIDAKSIYFEDPAGNIVELICRFSDAKPSEEPFTTASLQKVSEMSIVVTDKLNALSALQKVSIFERDREEISADGLSFMGEREDATYLLFVNEGRTWYFSNKKSAAYPVEIILDDGVSVKINEKLELASSVDLSIL
ncbi:VOC family protein [Solibacillus sp. FSL R7-0668]|uniref:VOC family protein n=1 Tax=Solibacillus sp. FSL R7-0668 TaxID=2921688 RepID=UPI0030F75107